MIIFSEDAGLHSARWAKAFFQSCCCNVPGFDGAKRDHNRAYQTSIPAWMGHGNGVFAILELQ